MTIKYTLSENDYLQHQLFIASKSDHVKKQRRKSWGINSIAIIFLGIIFYQSGNAFLTYYFLGTGLLFICLFPFYLRWAYKRHYKKFIHESYHDRFGEAVTLRINDDFIDSSSKDGEAKIKISEIVQITETGSYYYLDLISGGTLMIPKLDLRNNNELQRALKVLSDKLKIAYLTELDWKWK